MFELIAAYVVDTHSLLGLLTGITFYPIISVTTRHRLITWACRVIALVLSIVLFVVLIRNFYTSDPYAGLTNSSSSSGI
ncbi:hypothetical protein GYMLUDRAFT_829982 [Collybiopsis luxurians FD-317 M1]|uniref:Uncharacterized protein n=1 Tax=Collybiopsis luxurians FD-317 M1 TaxID=944289 RepID=A0A0D0CCR9_9AGAR|nr:hypothetical protein GYMLUDRAFT_829982 [Collybiopsis luxurians FD-317 M1]